MKMLFAFIFMTGILYSQNFEWAKVVPINLTTNPSYLSTPVTADAEANVISSRLIKSKSIFSLTYLGDNILEKHDTFGNLLWSDTVYGKVSLEEVKTDQLDNVIVAGIFLDTLKVNNLFIADLSGNPVCIIIKFNLNGEIIWHKIINTSTPGLRGVNGMAVDIENNIWVTAVNNFQDSFIKKFSHNGDELASFMQTGVRGISGVDIDKKGNVIVSGAAGNNSQSFNGYIVTPPYVYNMYVAKYSPAGVIQWIRFVQDITFQDFIVKCDISGNIFFSGNLFAGTNFGAVTVQGPNWVYDFFLAKMNSDGEFLWVRETPNQSPISGDASAGNSDFLSCDNDGDVYFAGFIRGSIDWGNGIVTNSLNLLEDVLILKYSKDGILLWGKTAGSSSSDRAQTITIDINGKCVLAGRVGANSMFDSLQFNGGSLNSFIAKLNQPTSIPVELISFAATYSFEGIELNWTTATELNNRGFEVERNEVGTRQLTAGNAAWKSICFVNGKGTTSEPQSYYFIDKSITKGKYLYRLKQFDFDGTFELSNVVEVSVMKPDVFNLAQNYPNPFNPSTTIRYTVGDANYESPAWVTLRIYDVLGNEVAALVNEEKSPGNYEINFDATNLPSGVSAKGGYASGVYYYRLQAGDFIETKKMTLLK